MSDTAIQLEASFLELSREEQLWLVERIIHALRETETRERAQWAASLDEMANDPDVQNENNAIEREFAGKELTK